jgi:hypothetical protein
MSRNLRVSPFRKEPAPGPFRDQGEIKRDFSLCLSDIVTVIGTLSKYQLLKAEYIL